MASYTKSRCNTTAQGTTLHSSHFHRAVSPNRFCSSSMSRSPVSNFVTRSSPVLARSTSPTRISLSRSGSPTVRFSAANQKSNPQPLKKTCACSPTTHPGSYRCGLHKKSPPPGNKSASAYPSGNIQLNMRRSAMTNSLVRIGTVEGELVRRALASLIRPSSNNQRRREDFRPRPSRFSVMSKAEDTIIIPEA